jgi:alpha-L-fucosidase
MRNFLLICLVFKCLYLSSQSLPTPTEAQLDWHDTEFYLFFHFGPNTFTDLEWGHGTEPEDLFNPSDLDCEQWCRVARLAGAKGVIITAKHHDGFCLWPSQFSKHTVRESRWRDGKGDVLQELAAACRRNGLKLGFYLSPWDRNHPQYGTPEYNDIYVKTLTELLTNYGDLFEIWWDGANGEGPNGKKQVYDFHRFERVANQLQPQAVIFSDIGPGCRWAGNERGLILTETNWCTLDTAGFLRGSGAPPEDTLNQGNINGRQWIPAECDVSIRPGWFYHKAEDEKVKSVDQLFDIYQKSVGRGANLILNVPPDRRGRIHENDSLTLAAFGAKLKSSFQENLALKGTVRRKNNSGETKWKTAGTLTDQQTRTGATARQIEVFWDKPQTFDCLLLKELLTKGQRVGSFKVEIRENGVWREIAHSTTIGPRKMLRFPTVTTTKMRVEILSFKAIPMLSEIGVYRL